MVNIVYIEMTDITFNIDIEDIAIDILFDDALKGSDVFVCDAVSTERRTTRRARKRNRKMS